MKREEYKKLKVVGRLLGIKRLPVAIRPFVKRNPKGSAKKFSRVTSHIRKCKMDVKKIMEEENGK